MYSEKHVKRWKCRLIALFWKIMVAESNEYVGFPEPQKQQFRSIRSTNLAKTLLMIVDINNSTAHRTSALRFDTLANYGHRNYS